MNERIRELAKQAGFKTNWQHEDVQAIKMARFEKFTQLIVRDCIDIVDSHRMKMDSGPTHIIEDFKKHFGVE